MRKRIILLTTLLVIHQYAWANQNVVYNIKPTYSPEPRYIYTRSPNDTAKLTDGKFANKHFWTSRESTVGWQSSGVIRIDFDLKSQNTLESITISTARGNSSGVFFPARADLYCSSDGKSYQYIDNVLNDTDLSDGPYLVKKFKSKLPSPTARYVTLFIVPTGKFVFLDEIEIRGTFEEQESTEASGLIPKGRLQDFQKNILAIEHQRKVFAFLRSRLFQHSPGQSVNSLDGQLSKNLKHSTELFAFNANQINEGSESFAAWSDNPWAQFTPVDTPPYPPTVPALSFHVAQDGASSQNLNVVSTFKHYTDATISIIWDDEYAQNAPEAQIHECRPISTRLGKLLGDPLIPIEDQIKFIPGESRQLMLTIKGKNPGEYSGSVEIASNTERLRIPLKVQIYKTHLNKDEFPTSNAWGYLTWRQIKNIPEKAIEDLDNHHTNFGILRLCQIQLPRKNGEFKDTEKFESAIRLQKDKKHILLFFNLRDENTVRSFGRYQDRDAWNMRLEKWIRDLQALCTKAGYNPKRLLFYPVDEPQNSEDAEKIINFSKILKKVDPDLRAYTTIDRIKRLSRYDFEKLTGACDVFQLDEGDLFSEDAQYLRFLRKDVWVYSTEGGKSASPMALYRLMAWRAFRGGATGIGFWAYADIGPEGSVWNDTDGARADFSVIYGDEERILSSKRWEAWREGCEDYALLKQVERKIEGTSLEEKFYSGIDHIITNPYDYVFFENFRIFLLETASEF